MSHMPAASTENGMAFAMPNVDNTQVGPAVVPIPYPSIAQLASADGGAENVMFRNKPALIESSRCSRSSGDEAGSNGGVKSGTNMGEVSFKQPSPKVYAGSAKVLCLLSTSSHNNDNAPLGQIVAPSQAVVLVSNS